MRVLATSIGAKAPLVEVIKQSMREVSKDGTLILADSNKDALARAEGDFFWHSPPFISSNAAEVCAALLALNLDAVIPTREADAIFFWDLLSNFSELEFKLLASPKDSIVQAYDKYHFFLVADSLGIPTIDTSLEAKPISMGKHVIKERFGSGSRGIKLGISPEMLEYESSTFKDPIFQPFVEGVEFSVDGSFSMQGDFLGLVVRSREIVSGGESQRTRVVRDPELEEFSLEVLERLSSVLPMAGPVCMQFIHSPHGNFVLEINLRFGGASSLSHYAGLKSIEWCLRENLEPSFRPDWNGEPNQLCMTRVPRDTFITPMYWSEETVGNCQK